MLFKYPEEIHSSHFSFIPLIFKKLQPLTSSKGFKILQLPKNYGEGTYYAYAPPSTAPDTYPNPIHILQHI